MDTKTVGMIGLGLMGTALTERLLEAGYAVWVHNRTRDKAAPLVARGAQWADNPLSVCDRVLFSLYTTDTVEEVLGQLNGGLRPGQILIDTTTGEPEQTVRLGARLAARGVQYLDAPISGSSEQTRRGEATAIIGGPEEAFAACRDLFDCCVRQTIYAGPCGSGSRMKLVSNLVLGLNRAALAEGLVFAQTLGIDLHAALQVLIGSMAYSRIMLTKGISVRPAAHEGGFPMNRTIILTLSAGLLALAASFGKVSDAAAGTPAVDPAVPRIQMTLDGPMAARVDGIIDNWLIPAPDANPGMLEMMRLRDRRPPYENPVPWAGEFVGKYLTSCALFCRLSDDPALREVTARVMRELIRTQAEDGYLGPFPDNHLLGRWDLWGHYHCMLAMILWHQDTGDPEALQAACRVADLTCATFLGTGKRVHDAGSHEMNMAVIHSLGLLYRQTKQDAYLRLMREMDGRRWHQIVSAWCAPVNDPLRVSIQDMELVVAIEQPGGGCRCPADAWRTACGVTWPWSRSSRS